MKKEGMMQGDPIVMILYALAVLLLILHIKELISMLGDITNQLTIKTWFDKLYKIGPPWGYIPEPEKSIMVASPSNLDKAKTFFANYKFKLKEGCCYLGRFLDLAELSKQYAEERVEEW
eukprot:3152427-Ditylum_brightwellii.AAC.1